MELDPASIIALIVDDREEGQKWIADLARGWNHQVLLAGSVNEAMELYAGHDVDYVMTDLEIPMEQGHEPLIEYGYLLIEELRARATEDQLYICVITAEGTSAGDSKPAWKARVNDYITKPCGPREAVQAIRDAVKLVQRNRQATSGPEQGLSGTPTLESRASAPPPAEADTRLKANLWKDVRITLGSEVRLSTASGGRGRALKLGVAERKALELLHAEGGDPTLASLFPGDRRYNVAAKIRKEIRENVDVEEAATQKDPLPCRYGRYTPLFLLRDQDGNVNEGKSRDDLRGAPKRYCRACKDPLEPYRCEDCPDEVLATHCRDCHREIEHGDLEGAGPGWGDG